MKHTTRRDKIYFIGYGDTGPVKIGTTHCVFTRLRHLQTACPELLKLLGTMNGDIGFERMLHKKFSEHRLRGEWFKRCEAIEKYITNHCDPPPKVIEPIDKGRLDELLKREIDLIIRGQNTNQIAERQEKLHRQKVAYFLGKKTITQRFD